MGNRWQRVWGVSWELLGLWSTSRSSLWWSSTRELSFYLPLCYVRQCDAIIRYVRYTVMILFYNLSTCVCDWSLGTHEFSAFNFILKIRCDNSAKNTRQKIDRQSPLCRVSFIGHSTKALPRAPGALDKEKRLSRHRPRWRWLCRVPTLQALGKDFFNFFKKFLSRVSTREALGKDFLFIF